MKPISPKPINGVSVDGITMTHELSLDSFNRILFDNIDDPKVAIYCNDTYGNLRINDPLDFFKLYPGTIPMEWDEIAGFCTTPDYCTTYDKIHMYLNCRKHGLPIYAATAEMFFDYYCYIILKTSKIPGLFNKRALDIARPKLCKFVHDTQQSTKETAAKILTSIFGNSTTGIQYQMAYDLNAWAYKHCKEIAFDVSTTIDTCDCVCLDKKIAYYENPVISTFIEDDIPGFSDKQIEICRQIYPSLNYTKIMIYLSWLSYHDKYSTSITDYANLRFPEEHYRVRNAIWEVRYRLSFSLDNCRCAEDFNKATRELFALNFESVYWDVYEWAAQYRPKAIRSIN